MLATLVLKNGRIYTMEPDQYRVQAIALSGNRILALGSDEEMVALLCPGGSVVDLEGRCVTPGLVDAHVHFRSYALQGRRIELAGASNLDETLERIAGALPEGDADQWILGRGWNQADWPGAVFPSATDLDRITHRRPALLHHKSGHAAWVNSRAMRLARITSSTQDPPGGKIQRDANGEPTGILFEEAIDLAANHVPKPSEKEVVAAMRAAQRRCLRAGLTGLHDFDGRSCFWALQTLRNEGGLQLRVVKNIPHARLEYAIGVGLRSGFGDDWIQIGGVKMFADGALGPRTALMLDPYEDEPDNFGIAVAEKEEMMALALQASANGLSVTIHAIGDRANHDVLDVYEALRRQESLGNGFGEGKAAGLSTPFTSLRHRIEHAQLLHPDDFRRFADLKVLASMQPIHATADMEMADRYWGERARFGYAWRTLLDTGATLVFGSDAPVEPIEPLRGIYAAVTRRRPDGAPRLEGWYPQQRLSVDQAIRAYTVGAAFASGRENTMGSISPGKLADFTIFDRDIFVIPNDELLEVNIAGTIVDGEFKFRDW